MILRASTWAKIRGRFTEEEKAALRRTVRGEMLCPYHGWDLAEEKLDAGLAEKLAKFSNVAVSVRRDEDGKGEVQRGGARHSEAR